MEIGGNETRLEFQFEPISGHKNYLIGSEAFPGLGKLLGLLNYTTHGEIGTNL